MGVPSFSKLVYIYIKDVHVCMELYVSMYVPVVCNELWLLTLTVGSCSATIGGVVLRTYYPIS